MSKRRLFSSGTPRQSPITLHGVTSKEYNLRFQMLNHSLVRKWPKSTRNKRSYAKYAETYKNCV